MALMLRDPIFADLRLIDDLVRPKDWHCNR